MTTIVQITDTHITGLDPQGQPRLAYGKVDTYAALKRAVAHINASQDRFGGIDAVIATGDLVDLGSAEEYRSFREIVAPLAPPLLLLPGNHDDPSTLRAAFPEASYLPAKGPFLDYTVQIGAVQVIGLDTTVYGKSFGRLEPEQLDWLTASLEASKDRPSLVFLHHPPFDTGIAHMDAQRLRNGEALLERLAGFDQLRLVAAGHVHRTITATVSGIPCAIAPSTAHAVGLDLRPEGPSAFDLEPGGVLVHHWTGQAVTSHFSPTGPWDGPYPFYDGAGKLLT
ncbi:MAG: phosphodiesterase [Rhodospirillaceae bacterium]